MAGDVGSADEGADRKREHEHPPEDQSTRHGSHPARRSPPELFCTAPADFAALWVGVEPRLFRRLVRDGFDPETARDLCQDVAGAFLRRPPGVRTREELTRLALLVGYRLSRRLRRREARLQIGGLPDVAAPDVADEVERRHVVQAVMAAVDALSDSDRQAFLRDPPEPGALSPSERNRLYVRLHRARRRLRDRLRGWLVGVYVGRYLPRRDDLLADGGLRAALLCTAAVVVAGTSLLQGGTRQHAAAAARDTAAAVGGAPHSVAVAADRTGQPATHAASARPAPATLAPAEAPAAAPGPPHPSVTVDAPLGTQAGASTGKRPPGDDSLVCWSGLRVVPDHCVQHPLRKDGESIVP